mgnify:CR=1 FL=1
MLNKTKTIKLKVIKNKKGDILKYINKGSKYFIRFGETYFNEIKKNQLKGWILHNKRTCLITVPTGKVEFKYKKNFNKKPNKIILSKQNYLLIIIPPKTWFCFKGLSKLSIIVNTIDDVHDDNETIKSKI